MINHKIDITALERDKCFEQKIVLAMGADCFLHCRVDMRRRKVWFEVGRDGKHGTSHNVYQAIMMFNGELPFSESVRVPKKKEAANGDA